MAIQGKRSTACANPSARLEVMDIFRQNWKFSLGACILGISMSAAYILMAPKEYEATVQLKMAMYSSCLSKRPGNDGERARRNEGECAQDIEKPAELIERLRLPVAYTAEVISACGESRSAEVGPFLNGKIRAHLLPGVEDGLELKLRANSPDTAKACANALFKMISTQQQGQVAKKVKDMQHQIADMQGEIAEQDRLLERIPQHVIRIVAYLTSFNKLSALTMAQDRLNERIVFATEHPTELLNPIYAPALPVSRSRSWILLFGAFAGLAVGVVLTELARQYRKLPD